MSTTAPQILVAPPRTAGPRTKRVVLYDYAYETFAIQYLAAILKAHGYPAEVYFDVSMDKDHLDEGIPFSWFLSLTPQEAAEAILELEPEVVGFSLITVFYPKLKAIMAHLKRLRPELVIIAGGPHCNMVPEEALKNQDIDFVFMGDADISLPRFLDSLEEIGLEKTKSLPGNSLPGVANLLDGQPLLRGWGPLMENLDLVPFPEKDTYYRVNPSLAKMYAITCSRGCAFRCTYCNSNNLRRLYHAAGQRYYRMRSVANVIAELKMAKRKYNPRQIMFLDSLFAGKKDWLRQFAESYQREIGLPYFCETNPNVHTPETIDLLADSGCVLIQFGFQSANEEVRKTILHRKESNKHISELVLHAKRRGIFVCVDHIANLPGETREHLEEAVKFYQLLRPDWINLGFLQFYPQAEIIEIALARRALAQTDIPAINRGEYQHFFRFATSSDLSDYYRTLPMRLFGAFKLPGRWAARWNVWIDNPAVAKYLAPLGSVFIYASRIFCAFTDRRDFLVRHHMWRNLHVLLIMLRRKMARYG